MSKPVTAANMLTALRLGTRNDAWNPLWLFQYVFRSEQKAKYRIGFEEEKEPTPHMMLKMELRFTYNNRRLILKKSWSVEMVEGMGGSYEKFYKEFTEAIEAYLVEQVQRENLRTT